MPLLLLRRSTFVVGAAAGAGRPALIAEIKRRSPSRGLLAPDFDPLRLARIYRENGAACISVLTDEAYSAGSLEDLAVRSDELRRQRLPLLRKDFICDPYQVYEARAAGADAVLLIVAALTPALLRDLHALARELGMAALVEVHTAEELETAWRAIRALVGINNRDLHDFRRQPGDDAAPVAARCPPRSASSPRAASTPQTWRGGGGRTARHAGVDAILVGEALVTARGCGARKCEN